MASGSKRRRGDDEYIFIDGKALRADEAIRIAVDTVAPVDPKAVLAPGQQEAQQADATGRPAGSTPADEARAQAVLRGRRGRRGCAGDRSEGASVSGVGELSVVSGSLSLRSESRRKQQIKYLAFGGALVALVLFSLCLSTTQPGLVRSPLEVASCIGLWFKLTYLELAAPIAFTEAYRTMLIEMPAYPDVMLQVWTVFKYAACGVLLALSGMLYQNTFRNPIAAPSMLGVTSGMNVAVLILVLQYGYQAVNHGDEYCLYSLIGGAAVLALVMLGGKWMSGRRRFNVVNMILMGTIVSQLLGVVVSYAQVAWMDEQAWQAYYLLQNALGVQSPWMALSLIAGGAVALVPVVLFRFQLNLVSFSDDEARLLGVNPTKLRLVALGCGSLMILVAQLNAGQVAMASLVVPFVARAVFGSEFRKQLGGSMLLGALVLLVCGDLSTALLFDGTAVGLGPVVTLFAMPLFVWMLAIRQRSWE
ncbi:iron ABC transporter permease [uncultured Adlercreutzia sp.]|uniref:iron ABC transporter permease n=1 Tax=uncultured Adlercreutzia sp. TaxID=875803 RepID=UPI0025F6029E|nr:iron ABC transporter permease [uncultured Adlercreutzia sp.]MCI9261577.1 iron ABC transporter permease [Eggerthellaceae bacterium]